MSSPTPQSSRKTLIQERTTAARPYRQNSADSSVRITIPSAQAMTDRGNTHSSPFPNRFRAGSNRNQRVQTTQGSQGILSSDMGCFKRKYFGFIEIYLSYRPFWGCTPRGFPRMGTLFVNLPHSVSRGCPLASQNPFRWARHPSGSP